MQTYYGTSGDDNYQYAGTDSLLAYGRAGNDVLSGGYSNDTLYGEDGNDNLTGGGGSNTLYGGNGNDRISSRVSDQAQFFYGGKGDDSLYAGYADDYLLGGRGNDKLYGSYGSDYLVGGSGSDFLAGTFGDSGEEDFDTLTGGTGADLFVLGFDYGFSYLGEGNALITDFSRNQGDKIQVTGSINNYSFSPTAAGTGIYYQNDLIAIVQTTTILSVSLDFTFV